LAVIKRPSEAFGSALVFMFLGTAAGAALGQVGAKIDPQSGVNAQTGAAAGLALVSVVGLTTGLK
jgi:hypothetical protein